jgi:hypothetical protein
MGHANQSPAAKAFGPIVAAIESAMHQPAETGKKP